MLGEIYLKTEREKKQKTALSLLLNIGDAVSLSRRLNDVESVSTGIINDLVKAANLIDC